MKWQDLNTINDFLAEAKQIASAFKIEMTNHEKESVASQILSLTFSDHFQEWSEKYPIAMNIEALSSDLEWSNAVDIDEDWEKLISFIDQLEQQVAHV